MRNELAENLVSAKTEKERRSLLKANLEIADIDLALALKDICYSFWTSEPTKAQTSAKALKSLEKAVPNDEISAFTAWISGIASITKGKIELAVESLSLSAASFLRLGKEHQAAQTQVSKLYALALLGRYDEAVETGKNAIKIFEKFDDQLAAGKVEKNLGNMLGRSDFYHQAETYFFSARKRFDKLRRTEETAMIENCLAFVYTLKNDFSEAQKFYVLALKSAEKSKMPVTIAEIEASLGNFWLFRGKYEESLRFLESSRQRFSELDMRTQTAIADLEIADAYLELNLAKEAFEIYKKIVPEFAKHKMQAEEARASVQFARSAILMKQPKIARRELKKSAALYKKEKNFVGAAGVMLNEAQFEMTEQDFAKSLEIAEESEIILLESGHVRQLLLARYLQSDCLRNLGDLAKAETNLIDTLEKSLTHEQTNLAQLCLISLGKIALQKNEIADAEIHFKEAILLIENLRDPLPSEEFRMAFLSDKLVAFEELAKIYLKNARLIEAFEMIEKSRARTLSESIQVKNKLSISNKNSENLEAKLNSVREELNWFYSRLSRAVNDKEFSDLQAQCEKREIEIATLTRQISAFSESGKSQSGELNLAELQNQLGKNRVLIEFVCFGEEISAFVVSNESVNFVENLGNQKEITQCLAQIRFQFGALRYGRKLIDSFLSELTKRTNHYLGILYNRLLRPVKDLIGEKDLVIVPAKGLHYVPFNALYDGEKYLIEKREVSLAPSAKVLQVALQKRRTTNRNALLIGFADEKVPLVNDEINSLKQILPQAKSLIGKDATFSNFKSLAPKADILHIACHGKFRSENPMFSSLHLADGFVTVRDVCALDLRCNLVTLSACETGLNEISAGEEILGLSRGFISAGANSLMLSLWTVDDESTMNLMKVFYSEIEKGNSFAQSLRMAQIREIELTSHPYFWASFVLIGKY